MANMTWTTTKPTKAGWYWWRMKNGVGVVQFCIVQEIAKINGRLVVEECGDLTHYTNDRKHVYEWSSEPLEPPGDAKRKETP